MSSPTPPPPPWLDLPDHVMEEILERLPLSDYVRFPAVCQRWRSVQSDHRRRHAPFPPPMLRLPWLIRSWGENESIMSCYSPLEGRSFQLPIRRYCFPLSGDGWLCVSNFIVNPVSGVKIPLPEQLDESKIELAAISPPPHRIVFFITDDGRLLVWRFGDRHWTQLQLPPKDYDGRPPAVAFGGKLHCIFYEEDLLVADALSTPPAVHLYPMSTLPPLYEETLGYLGDDRLVESDGEVLLVTEINQGGGVITFRVLKPDVSKKRWTRVESLGDRLLVFGPSTGSVSLLAGDVGLKRNCIYFPNIYAYLGGKYSWEVFDLGTGTSTEVLFPNASLHTSKDGGVMFMPSIC